MTALLESKPAKRIVIAVLVGAYLVFDYWATASFFLSNYASALLITGVLLGQLNLVAIWATVAPGSIVVRLPWCILLCALMSICFVIGLRQQLAPSSGLFQMGALLCAFVGAQLPFWIPVRVILPQHLPHNAGALLVRRVGP